jgi:hypothetical protein
MYLPTLGLVAETHGFRKQKSRKQLGDSLKPSKPFLWSPGCSRLPLEFTHVLDQPMA